MSAQKETTEVIFYRGKKYCRYPDSPYPANHYFRPSKNDGSRKALHQAIWEDANGPVPDGFELHHRDGNKGNNTLENIQLVPKHHVRIYHRDNIKKAMEAAKAWHASPEGLAWHSEHAQQMGFGHSSVRHLVCEHCGQEFETTKVHMARFCSNACKSAWRRAARLDDETKQCTVCGAEFISNRYDKTKTCSHKCAGLLASCKRYGRHRAA